MASTATSPEALFWFACCHGKESEARAIADAGAVDINWRCPGVRLLPGCPLSVCASLSLSVPL